MTAQSVKVKTCVEVEAQSLTDLLTSALEGGSNYWYTIMLSGGAPNAQYSVDVPQLGGWLDIVADCDGEPFEHNGVKRWRLDWAMMEKGLQIMAQKYPRHFGNFMQENADAETGDVFLQCCLFEEIIFG